MIPQSKLHVYVLLGLSRYTKIPWPKKKCLKKEAEELRVRKAYEAEIEKEKKRIPT